MHALHVAYNLIIHLFYVFMDIDDHLNIITYNLSYNLKVKSHVFTLCFNVVVNLVLEWQLCLIGMFFFFGNARHRVCIRF